MFMRLALPLSRLHYITRAEPRQAGWQSGQHDLAHLSSADHCMVITLHPADPAVHDRPAG